MTKQLIFIDDSGDPGFKKSSSEFLVMAAVIFNNPKTAEAASKELTDYRKELGWPDEQEFKFSKDRKEISIGLLRRVKKYEFEVYAVKMQKSSFDKMALAIAQHEIYTWAIKELLCIIPNADAKIKIDGHANKREQRQSVTYLRREANPGHARKLEIKYVDSKKNNLIQLADTVVGAIHRSLHKEKTDSRDHINVIKTKISIIAPIDPTKNGASSIRSGRRPSGHFSS